MATQQFDVSVSDDAMVKVQRTTYVVLTPHTDEWNMTTADAVALFNALRANRTIRNAVRENDTATAAWFAR